MLKALNTAATGMAAQEANVTTISNNIANVNTTGFKSGRTEFEDLLYETQQESGAQSSATTNYNVGLQVGSGARVSATKRIMSQGSPQITNNPFDLMIQGDGFFGVVLPNNELQFTRDGAFNVSADGTLQTKSGYKIFPGITMPQGTINVNINSNGQVEAYVKGQVEPQVVGNIPVFTFTNPVGLKNMGENLMAQTVGSGQPNQGVAGESNAGTIRQGALEASNVQIMTEMTNLIRAQRAYEMNSKVMGVADQMLQNLNQLK